MEVQPKLTEKPIQIKEMSHVERAIYRYLRGMIGGFDVLKTTNYRLYGITTILVAFIPSCVLVINSFLDDQIPQEFINLLLLGEAIFVLAILITAIFGHLITEKPLLIYVGMLCLVGAIFIGYYLEYFNDERLFLSTQFVFYSWMFLLSISFLGFIRSFFAEWFGAVVWAGNPEGRILFSPVIRLILVASMSLPIYAGYKSLSDPSWSLVLIFAVLSLVIVLISTFIIPKKEKGNIFGTILAYFYLYSLYHGATSFVRGISSSIFIVDAGLLIVGALYSVQAMTRRAARFKNPILKKVREERWVLIILALGLGYHLTSLRSFVAKESSSELISNFHLGSFMACSVIMLVVLLSFLISRRFHNWFVAMPTTQDAVKEVLKLYGPQTVRMAISALLGASREKMEELVRGVPDTAATVGRRIFNEVRTWIGEQARKTKDQENDEEP